MTQEDSVSDAFPDGFHNTSHQAKLKQIELLLHELDEQRQSSVGLQSQGNIPPHQPMS